MEPSGVENRVLETLASRLQGRRSTYDELIPLEITAIFPRFLRMGFLAEVAPTSVVNIHAMSSMAIRFIVAVEVSEIHGGLSLVTSFTKHLALGQLGLTTFLRP